MEMGKVTCPTKAAIFSKIFAFLSKYLPRSNKVNTKCCQYKIFKIFALNKILASLLNICLHIKIFASLSKYFRVGRKRADEMGSELGPEHDHDMDQTSISQKVFMSGTVCLFCCQSTLMITSRHRLNKYFPAIVYKWNCLPLSSEYFVVASLVPNATAFETNLESPSQKFDEGLPRCFQFWYMLEVCIHKYLPRSTIITQSDSNTILTLDVKVHLGEIWNTVWRQSESHVETWFQGQVSSDLCFLTSISRNLQLK